MPRPSFLASSCFSPCLSISLVPALISVQLPTSLPGPPRAARSPGPIGLPFPSPLSPLVEALVFSSPPFRSSVIASRSRGPLGFTWRALMTSRNERVPPPSNKRLFHVPMLILRESSSRLFDFPSPPPLSLSLSAPPPSTSRSFRATRIVSAVSGTHEMKTRERKNMRRLLPIRPMLKQYTCHDASSLSNVIFALRLSVKQYVRAFVLFSVIFVQRSE